MRIFGRMQFQPYGTAIPLDYQYQSPGTKLAKPYRPIWEPAPILENGAAT